MFLNHPKPWRSKFKFKPHQVKLLLIVLKLQLTERLRPDLPAKPVRRDEPISFI